MRLAIICTECNARQFGKPDWRCEKHPTKCVIQPNAPYMGREVPTPEVEGLAIMGLPKAKKK